MHKGNQKRIYFDGAVYFVTFNTKDWVRFFEEPIFCEVFMVNLRLCKQKYKFNLYGFVLMPNHFHFLFQPRKARELSKIVQFLKRNTTRNINYVLEYVIEGAINESLLRWCGNNDFSSIKWKNLHVPKLNYNKNPNKFSKHKELIAGHYDNLKLLKQQFTLKYRNNLKPYPKFRWQKSFFDHYIRNNDDFDYHLQYIYNNPYKHKIPNPQNYQYIFTKHPELIG